MSRGVGRRRGSDPKLLWLWRRPAATADSTSSLGTSICRECGPKNTKKKKKKKKEELAWEDSVEEKKGDVVLVDCGHI